MNASIGFATIYRELVCVSLPQIFPTNHLGGLRTASALCVALEPWPLPCEKEGLAPIAQVMEHFEKVTRV